MMDESTIYRNSVNFYIPFTGTVSNNFYNRNADGTKYVHHFKFPVDDNLLWGSQKEKKNLLFTLVVNDFYWGHKMAVLAYDIALTDKTRQVVCSK